jgi:IS5 family transposase
MAVAMFGTCAFIFFRFWDRGLVHIAFGDRIVRHCHRLAAQQFRLLLFSLTLRDLYGSIPVIEILSDVFQGPNRLANNHGMRLRQSYVRVAKRAAMMVGRYAHAKQFNHRRRELRILHTVWAG